MKVLLYDKTIIAFFSKNLKVYTGRPRLRSIAWVTSEVGNEIIHTEAKCNSYTCGYMLKHIVFQELPLLISNKIKPG